MRQSEYTTFYERRGNVKYPVRGKLFMRHRGRAIYVRNGVLTDGLTGRLVLDFKADAGGRTVIESLDIAIDFLVAVQKTLPSRLRRSNRRPVKWRSMRNGCYTVNGKVIATKEDTHEQR
ncbi:hypothetical protein [Paenibacillus wenxiniae]|uniref:Uncharacterized protein n=1 Tax=Paenibacillus wenxiniae TaxID=1636843 RepID=A0ABW4RCP8_9BACL